MKNPVRSEVTPFERRKRLLEDIPGFATMPPALLNELAAELQEEQFPLGAVIVAEGDAGDRLYIIEEGEAEVSTAGANAAVSLAILGPGDMFGEIALLAPSGRRQATVTAITPVLALRLSGRAFKRGLAACPDARVDLAVMADTLLTAKFLKQQGSWRS
jgi:CRP-like cAMP-binding protein